MTAPCLSPSHVANSVLRRAFAEHADVTPMKLQRILYFLACEYAKDAGGPLFNEQFQTWEYGPVLRSLHDKFRPLAGKPIAVFWKDAAGFSQRINESQNRVFRHALDAVWNSCRDVPVVTLSRITHLPGSAWYQAYVTQERQLSTDAMAADTTYAELLGLTRLLTV